MPSNAASATTTGATSSSPQRPGPGAHSPSARRTDGPRPRRGRVLHGSGRPRRGPAPARESLPRLRRALLPAPARVRQVPGRGLRGRPARAAWPVVDLDVRPRPAVRQEGRPRRRLRRGAGRSARRAAGPGHPPGRARGLPDRDRHGARPGDPAHRRRRPRGRDLPLPADRRGRAVKLAGTAIAGSGIVRVGNNPPRPTAELARDAGLAALHDAGMTLSDVDEAFVGYIQPGSLLGVRAMKELGLTGLPGTPRANAPAT